MDEERLLDTLLLEELEKSGKPGKISFEDPDAVIAIETVGTWAGLALFTGRRKSGIRSFGLSDRKRVLPVVCVKAIGNLLNNNFRKKVALIRNFQKERCR